MFLDRIANIVLIVLTLFSSLINITIIRIHIKQPLLKDAFFSVVFGQIIVELIINIAVFFQNLIYLIVGDGENPGKWFAIIPTFFNFAYVASHIYNIRIIYYLITYNKDKEDLISYDLKDNEVSRDSNLTHRTSIAFFDVSFKSFHYLAFVIATIHTIFNLLNLFIFQNIEVQSKDWRWFYYFIYGKEYFWRIFFFIPNFIFFFISIYYFIKSFNKNKISKHIYLRSYSIYCIFGSLISLFIPITFFIFWLGFNNNEKAFNHNYLLFILLGFFIYLLSTTIFRVRNYYVNYILTQDGKSFLNWLNTTFGILFCHKKMKELNFVDLNSSFIYHALASPGDFILDDETQEIPLTDATKRDSTDL